MRDWHYRRLEFSWEVKPDFPCGKAGNRRTEDERTGSIGIDRKRVLPTPDCKGKDCLDFGVTQCRLEAKRDKHAGQ